MKKKLIVICLILTLALSVAALAACNDKNGRDDTGADDGHPFYYVSAYIVDNADHNFTTDAVIDAAFCEESSFGATIGVEDAVGYISFEREQYHTGEYYTDELFFGLIFEDEFAAGSYTDEAEIDGMFNDAFGYDYTYTDMSCFETRGRVIYAFESESYADRFFAAADGIDADEHAAFQEFCATVPEGVDVLFGDSYEFTGGIYFDGENDEMNFDVQYAWWDDYEANSILSTALVADEEVMQAYYENYSAQIESKIEFGEIESGECKLENGMLWATMLYQERA